MSPSRPTNKHSGRTALLPLGLAVLHDEQAHSPTVPAAQSPVPYHTIEDVHQLAVAAPVSHQPGESSVRHDDVHQVAVTTFIGQERTRSNSVFDNNQGTDVHNLPASQHKSYSTSPSYPAVPDTVSIP